MATQQIEQLLYLDIFRFTTKQNECELFGNDNKNNPYVIPCLNISPRLIDEKIIEPSQENGWLELQKILFSRMMIEDYDNYKTVGVQVPKQHLLFSPDSSEISNCNDNQILRYLYGCFYRLSMHMRSRTDMEEFFASINSVIMGQVKLYLTEPFVFPDREKRMKGNQDAPLLLNLVIRFKDSDTTHSEVMQQFVIEIGKFCKKEDESALEKILTPTYNRLCQRFSNLNIDEKDVIHCYNVTMTFIQSPEFAEKFMQRIMIKKDSSLAYQSTLLGYMLCVSNLTRPSQNKTKYFQIGMSDSERKTMEQALGLQMFEVSKVLHKIFHQLLKHPQTKSTFLRWLGRCLYTFKDRKKLWNNQLLMNQGTISVSDGFLMNLLSTMMHLSEPFAGPFNHERLDPDTGSYSMNKRMLKIDPMYCRWSKTDPESSKTNMLGLAEETFLVQSPNDDSVKSNYEPNFITECFYATHLAFSYGFRSVYERFFKLTQNLNELQQTYTDMMNQPDATRPGMNVLDPREIVKARIDQEMSTFMNLKTILMEPQRVRMQTHFVLATADYLNHLAACSSYEDAINAKEYKRLTLADLREKKLSRACFEFIPEMLIENILDFMLFVFLFNEDLRNDINPMLDPIMTLIIVYMGESKLMQNPHLRARFAEILEYIMPHLSHLPSRQIIGSDQIFLTHPLIEELVPSLVNVFVSIEMTGEGVQFEQKFSYRRPMYVVLKYLWNHQTHKTVLIRLADEAEQNIESARPPLMLRFINLLINDAIFLLDEALNYMNQLKEAEQRKKSDEWKKMTPQQRAQQEAVHSHIGRLAKFHNVLSLSTIGTLAWMTTKIKTIFCHPTLVDRIANMLNYFLENLVGDKRKNFNVNDKADYDFQPKKILQKICEIYVNLGSLENPRYSQFCTAVSSDGRSYNENLLPKAIEIMYRNGMSGLATEFEKLSQLVHKIAVQNQLDEIPTEDIPDTFLDPIMSTLMQDPVLLPSSNMIVDRSTIARHLLSDQTDPFNRSPLSMEDVIPEVDLKNQILTFLRDRRAARKQQNSET